MRQPPEIMPTEEIVAFKRRLQEGDVGLISRLVAHTRERVIVMFEGAGCEADHKMQCALKSDGASQGVLLDRASQLPGREWPEDLHNPTVWATFLGEIEASELVIEGPHG